MAGLVQVALKVVKPVNCSAAPGACVPPCPTTTRFKLTISGVGGDCAGLPDCFDSPCSAFNGSWLLINAADQGNPCTWFASTGDTTFCWGAETGEIIFWVLQYDPDGESEIPGVPGWLLGPLGTVPITASWFAAVDGVDCSGVTTMSPTAALASVFTCCDFSGATVTLTAIP